MELDSSKHPSLTTSFRFEGVELVTEKNDVYWVNILVEFRSFLPGEPYQVLDRVSAEILEGKDSFSDPADTQVRYQLRSEVQDVNQQAKLFPFRASLLLSDRFDFGSGAPKGLPLNGSFIDLRPLPALRIILPQLGADDAMQRAWGSGFAFEDVVFSQTPFMTSDEVADGTRVVTDTKAHVYAIQVEGSAGQFCTFPGESTIAHKVTEELAARHLGGAGPEPTWIDYPDHYLSLPGGTFKESASFHHTHVALCGLLKAVTDHTPVLNSILLPIGEQSIDGRFSLLGGSCPTSEQFRMETIPFRNSGISLAPLLQTCWPRVEHLLRVGFNFAALSGWFHRGKNVNPIEQGFLNLFVFLECLKANWTRVRNQAPTSFEGDVNRTLKEILGHRKKINEFVEFRNRIVHEGESGLPIDDLIDRYSELHRLCASVYLSLIGWTGKWEALRSPPNASPRMVAQDPWWSPPDLVALLPLP